MRRRQAKISEYVTRRKIYKLFAGAERMEVYSRFLKCPDQEHGPAKSEREVARNGNSV